MKKESIIEALEEKFSALGSFIESLPEGRLSPPLAAEKWSIGQHAMHLVLSTRAVTRGMLLPKEALAEKFGLRGDSPERDYDTLVALYHKVLAGGMKSPERFVSDPVPESEKPALLDTLQQELADIIAATRQWDEPGLSAFILPHPALGNLTLREMLIFTIYHTQHHLSQMERA